MGLAGTLVNIARARRTAHELRYRRLPALAVSDTGGPATVYYLCPDYDTPSGGVRVAYRHVDYSDELWWTFALDGDAPRMLRASLVVVVLLVMGRL